MNPFGGFSADAGPIEDRPLGTMVTYGYPEIEFDDELSLAIGIGASLLEILPHWGALLDPTAAQASRRSWFIDSQRSWLLGRANDPRS